MSDKQKLDLIQAILCDFLEYGEDQSAKTVLYVIGTVLEFEDPKNKK